MTTDVTFTDEAIQLSPFPAYDTLREEQQVYVDPVTGHYVLTRYDDSRNVLINHADFSNRTGFLGDRWCPEANKLFQERGWLPMDTLVSNDPPEHRRFRTLVDKVFTASRVAALEPRMSEIISDLIDAFPADDEFDFLEAFAIPLPMYVIAEQLGVSRDDRARFKGWSDAITETTDPTMSPERQMDVAHIVIDMQLYMAKEIDRVRAEPNELLLSQLANFEAEGRQLTMGELQSLLLQILVAGNETTTTTLASGMKLMIERPELAAAIHADPERARTLLEETLRTETPLQTLFRRTQREVSIADVAIPAGAAVEVRFGAANRDPRQFGCPADVDLDRKNAKTHLAFSTGIHTCVGHQLARGELRLAFQALTRRLTNFRYSRGERSIDPLKGYTPHGPRSLWMQCDSRKESQ